MNGPGRSGGSARTVLVANPSADLYGSDRMVLEGVRGLVEQGWRVVVTCSRAGPLVEPLLSAGAEVEIEPVPVVRKAALSPRGLSALLVDTVTAVPRMWRLVRRVQPAVILVNTVTLPIWLVVARLTGTPVVVHVHEAEASLRKAARLALNAPLNLATSVVYNSRTSRQVSRALVPELRGRVTVVHNGVPGPPVVRPAREHLDGSLRVVYVGRLSPRKGVDLAVRAVRHLVDAGVEASLEIVGSVFPGYEWYEEELRELVRELGLGERVVLAGFQAEVWPHLERADVAVVPSRLDESFGNVVVEALLAARPVVVSDHTGLREAAEGFEAAVLSARDDADALAENLSAVRQHWPDYRARAMRDAATARARFAPERYREGLAAALQRSAQGSTLAPAPVPRP